MPRQKRRRSRPPTRVRLETLAERIITLLDALDGDPDVEPDHDGEDDVAEASLQPTNLTPDRVPVRRIPIRRGAAPLPARDASSLTAARMVPIVGDGMHPTLREGDVAWALPCSRYAFEGLYILDLAGTPQVLRCEARQGSIRVTHDNPAYAGFTLAPEDFEAMVVGQVAAVGRIVAPTLLDGRTAR